MMSFIGLRVPHETARLLSELDIPGQKVPLDHCHITIILLGDNVPIDVLANAMVAVFKAVSETPPFTVSTSRLSCFPKNAEGLVPIICSVESDPLHQLKRRLIRALSQAGVPFEDKFPVFKPHVTLAWAKEVPVDQQIPRVEWGAHELVMWGGDEGDGKVVVTFPFTLRLAERVATKFLRGNLLGKAFYRASL